MIEKFTPNTEENKQEKEPKSLIERLQEAVSEEHINLYTVKSFIKEAYRIEDQEGYYQDSNKFAAILSEKDPFSESKIDIDDSEREGWKRVKTDSWEKAFLLGLVPGKEEIIPEFTLDQNGNSTDTPNPFWDNVEKLNR